MLKERSDRKYNIPNPSFDKGKIIKKLDDFIVDTLLIFHAEFQGYTNASEEVLSEHLAKTLDYYAKPLPFIFQKEAIQSQPRGHKRNVDIGVFLHYANLNPFFTIEAKRLPTLPKSREKEYVVGNDYKKPSGGIERFKLNLHGINLSESALVAFVQSGSLKGWYHQINEWISLLTVESNNPDLEWTNEDMLKNICGYKKAELSRFTSVNKKNNNTTIQLFHYLIDLSDLKKTYP
ncbi:MAG: hypothetical protein ACQESQ_09995 [Bacteroidota bacterium]